MPRPKGGEGLRKKAETPFRGQNEKRERKDKTKATRVNSGETKTA